MWILRQAFLACALAIVLAPSLHLEAPIAWATSSPPETADPALEQVILAALPSDAASYGIVVKNLASGESAFVNADKVFVSASLYKLAVMYEAFRQREAGVFPFSASVRAQLSAMIVYSDNDAAWALFGQLGISRINATMRDLGFPHTIINDPTTTTARETARLLEMIYRGEAVDAESSREMLDLLLQQQIKDRLPALLPPGTAVAHKTGNLDSYVHDAGIVYAPSGPYVIVVLTSNSYSWGVSSSSIARLSRIVYDYFEASQPASGERAAVLTPTVPLAAPLPAASQSPAASAVAAKQPVPWSGDPPALYFPETGHYVKGPFLQFFRQHGELEIFGYPLTEAFEENGLTVQYFQRQRMEWWPDNPAPFKVQLTLIGDEVLSSVDSPFSPEAMPTAGTSDRRYFAETGHTISDAFKQYFDRHGGLDIFGYPTSEPVQEDGVTVQHFQRGRLEWRPGNPDPFKVQLNLLGYRLLEQHQVPSELRVPLPPAP